MIRRMATVAAWLFASAAWGGTVVVYGGTPAGVAAAVTAARGGQSVTLIEPSRHLGGVVSGGLTRTDIGRIDTVGGFAREFFDRCYAHYVATYGADSAQAKDSRGGIYTEPHVAELVFEALLAEAGVSVERGLHIVAAEVEVSDPFRRVRAITAADDAGERRSFAADGFVDASYEGDLMALAGVPYLVGRESRETYGEEHAGIRSGPPEAIGKGDHRTQAYNYRLCLTDREDIRVYPPEPPGYDRGRYAALLAYILTVKPETIQHTILNIEPVANGKYDANNCGYAWQSTDWVGHNYTYPEADWAERQRIAAAHLNYVQGLFYFLQNDPEVPTALREDARRYGLAADEFADHDHWPHQLYVREARRMIGAYVFTERDARSDRHKPDSVGIGSYTIDCHGCQTLPAANRPYTIEGGLGVAVRPYEIPYRILCPPQHTNLLVAVCVSASHVGYCTLRMEPVYMMLGHAAGVAIDLAIDGGLPVQEVPIEALQTVLREQQALLDAPFQPLVEIRATPAERVAVGEPVTFEAVETATRSELREFWWELTGDGEVDATERQVTRTFDHDQNVTVWLRVRDAAGERSPYARYTLVVGAGGPEEIVLDDEDRGAWTARGTWLPSRVLPFCLGEGYHHDDNQRKGDCGWRFRPTIVTPGRYLVSLGVVPHENRATNIPVVVYHADGETRLSVNGRVPPGEFPWQTLGTFRYAAGTAGSVLVENRDTDGYVAVDSLRMTWQGP